MTTFNVFSIIMIIIIVFVPKPNTKLCIYNYKDNYSKFRLKSSSFNQNQI